MNSEQRMVTEFHREFLIPLRDKPTGRLPYRAVYRRISLIREEINELVSAFVREDPIEIADCIADILYVVYGTAVECGIDMEEVFKEVHRSNMTKTGGTYNDYGKLIKPDSYEPPNLEPIIKKQIDGK